MSVEGPYRRILVGYDGSEQSQDALELGRLIATGSDGELIAVAVLDYDPLPIAVGAYERAVTEDSERIFAGLAEKLEGLRLRTDAIGGASAPAALNQVAEREDADLIVLGSSHRGTIGQILPGSTGERLLQGAPCAVTIAPLGYATREHLGVGIVGVGYDGTEEARSALRAAATLAGQVDAELRVIAVVPPLDSAIVRATGRVLRDEPVIREDYEERLEAAREQIPDSVPAELRLLDGDPATALAEQGVELDLLVVGSRGYGPIRTTLLGGVSGRLIRIAPCPVIVLPRGVD